MDQGTSGAADDDDADPSWAAPRRLATTALASLPSGDVSRHGIHDLAGNVWEWTTVRWKDSGSVRVVQGGTWTDEDPSELRADTRRAIHADSRYNALWFRCVQAR